MKNVLKSRLTAGILILTVVCLGIVFAGDVIVKEGTLDAENINATGNIVGGSITATGTIEGGSITTTGTIEGVKFKSTGCTATGTNAVALGYQTEATGHYGTALGYNTTASDYYSTAMGFLTTASGDTSTAMGFLTTASGDTSTATGFLTTASGDKSFAAGVGTSATGDCSVAMGSATIAGSANYTTAIGKSFTNNVQDSFAVGFTQKDFSVVSGLVTVHNNLYVNGWVSAEDVIDRSSFYDKDTYGRALDYLVDSSNTIKLSAEGQKEYNHEVDPEFVQRRITLKDYDKYTEEEVWDDLLEKAITNRIYETHQELGSSVTMKLSWLTQCVFELKQENQTLKDEITQLKAAVGIE